MAAGRQGQLSCHACKHPCPPTLTSSCAQVLEQLRPALRSYSIYPRHVDSAAMEQGEAKPAVTKQCGISNMAHSVDAVLLSPLCALPPAAHITHTYPPLCLPPPLRATTTPAAIPELLTSKLLPDMEAQEATLLAHLVGGDTQLTAAPEQVRGA